MSARSRRVSGRAGSLVLLGLVLSLPCSSALASETPQTAPAAIPCQAPAPEHPDLVAGLALYDEGQWAEAADRLGTWASGEGAETDPAAARGLYCLSYALNASRQSTAASAAADRALALLVRRARSGGSLEELYYLAALQSARNEIAAQLSIVSRVMREHEAGRLCPSPDGDDLFRLARLYGWANRAEREIEFLRRSQEAHAEGRGSIGAYRSLGAKELGEALLSAGDAAAAATHLRAAAELDRTIPGVHRLLGMALIAQGELKAAADHWRRNWRHERQGGNDLLYVVRVLDDNVRYQRRFGTEHAIEGLTEHTLPALEQNAVLEARTFLTLTQETAAARERGEELPPEKATARDVADYRMNQFLLEYVRRGEDLAEFALQNGLLAAIHHRSLPRR